MLVAQAFEKIRINPGNFVDGRKTFEEINYDKPGEFEAERDHIREVSLSLVKECGQDQGLLRVEECLELDTSSPRN